MVKLLLAALCFLIPSMVLAADLSTMADGLMGPMLLLTKLMRYACYVTGVVLCFGAIGQYRLHLQNPKLTPIFTPILMLVLGVILILLPYFTTMFGNSWSAEEIDAGYANADPKDGHLPSTLEEYRQHQQYREDAYGDYDYEYEYGRDDYDDDIESHW